jgi:hypothetical protein
MVDLFFYREPEETKQRMKMKLALRQNMVHFLLQNMEW